MLSRCFLDFSVGVRASVIGLSQISSFSLSMKNGLSHVGSLQTIKLSFFICHNHFLHHLS